MRSRNKIYIYKSEDSSGEFVKKKEFGGTYRYSTKMTLKEG